MNISNPEPEKTPKDHKNQSENILNSEANHIRIREQIFPLLPNSPGVYLMKDALEQIIYVGKAKNLKKRVQSYFYDRNHSAKIVNMIKYIVDIETIVTRIEADALLLEHNLIRINRPKFNTLLRDDKSYPYIYFSAHKEFPFISMRRHAHGRLKKISGQFIGPFVSVGQIKQLIVLLQKIFKIRTCKDHEFKGRSRACMKYQIDRCSAPCIGLINEDDYKEDLKRALLFLRGKSDEIIGNLSSLMQQASISENFEKAAVYRDQMMLLRDIQQRKQSIQSDEGEVDVWGVASHGNLSMLILLQVRDGKILSQHSFAIKNDWQEDEAHIFNQFLPQYYLQVNQSDIPATCLLPKRIEDAGILQQAFEKQHARLVDFIVAQDLHNKKEELIHWHTLAMRNASEHLQNNITKQDLESLTMLDWRSLAKWLDIDVVERMECFDISHFSGEATVASCVVFEHGELSKKNYRRYNIYGIKKADDYAAIEQAVFRRFRDHEQEDFSKPTVLMIDGGLGQLKSTYQALNSVNFKQPMLIIGVAKGVTRKAGRETLFLIKYPSLQIEKIEPSNDENVMRIIWNLRDEAHRFAITAQRRAVRKSRTSSSLEDIAGVGAKRRKLLLNHFGSIDMLRKASIDEIARVRGIGKKFALSLYSEIHGESNS